MPFSVKVRKYIFISPTSLTVKLMGSKLLKFRRRIALNGWQSTNSMVMTASTSWGLRIQNWLLTHSKKHCNQVRCLGQASFAAFGKRDTTHQWAPLTRLPCLVFYVKLQFVHTTKSKMGSQLLLTSTSSHVQLWRGSEKAFNECLGVSNVFPTAA